MDAFAFLDGAVPLARPVPVNYHRPSGYSEDLARRICDQIAEGKILRQICTGQDGMPAAKSTVYRWLAEEPEFRALYGWAVRCRTEGLAEDIIEIADDSSRDFKLEDDGDDKPIMALQKEAIARSHLRIASRQWLLTKQLPRQYGAKPDDMPAPVPNGDDAKPINQDPQRMIEADPLYPQVMAWEQAAEKAKT